MPSPSPLSSHSTLDIRIGTEAEADFFLEIEEQTTWENLPPDRRETSREELRIRLHETHTALLHGPDNVVFLACDPATGEKMGLLWFGARLNSVTGEREAWVFNLTVIPTYRGRGVAQALMEHAEEYARAQGFEVIGLKVATHNEAARGLYHKLNYEESSILMRKNLTSE
jgi:ribosomal protein S18 acetylase RimI-like enzyme